MILKKIKNSEICMVINTPTLGKDPYKDGFQIRSLAERYKLLCFTSLDTAKAYLLASKTLKNCDNLTYETLDYYIETKLAAIGLN